MLAVIRQGSAGGEVAVAQAQLNLAPSKFAPLSLDGRFGPLTLARTLEFQKQHGLSADGIIGPATWAALAQVRGRDAVPAVAASCDNGNPAHQAKSALYGQAFQGGALQALVPAQKAGQRSSVASAVTSLPSVNVAGATLVPLVGSPMEALARGVYYSSLHYDRIFLSGTQGLQGRAFTLAAPVPPLVVPSLPAGGWVQILNIGGITTDRDTLIHELGHAWQSQHHSSPLAYARNCVLCQGGALARNKLAGLLDGTLTTQWGYPVGYPFSAYAYRPGKAFSSYGGEQIAEQIENGEAGILAHVVSVPAGMKNRDNEASLNPDNICFDDLRAAGVKK